MKNIFILPVVVFMVITNCQKSDGRVPKLTEDQKQNLSQALQSFGRNAVEIPVLSTYQLRMALNQDQLRCMKDATGLTNDKSYNAYFSGIITLLSRRLCMVLILANDPRFQLLCIQATATVKLQSQNGMISTVNITNVPNNVLQLDSYDLVDKIANDQTASLLLIQHYKKIFGAYACLML